MKKIIFVRHGESEANAGGISRPNELILLTDKGIQQAQEVANHWAQKPVQVYISEFLRTKQTAQPLLDKFEMEPIKIAGLNEFDIFSYEILEGLTGEERLSLTAAYWKELNPDARHGEKGQTYREFCQRITDFIPTLLTLENNSVIFGHGMWFRQLVWQTLGFVRGRVDAQNMQEFSKFSLALPVNNTDIFDLHLTDTNVFVQKQ